MLHGWGQTLESLLPLGELLGPWARVHLIDLPGFGASPMPEGDWDTSQYAERILAYMDDHGLEQVDLLGHSFGGRVAIRLASKYPERVRRLVLIDSAGLPPKRSLVQKLRMRWSKWLGVALSLLSPFFGPGLKEWHGRRYGSEDYKNAGPLRGTLVKTVTEDLTRNASEIKAPTLLIWGERDTTTPLEMGRRFQSLIAGSKLVQLPGKDHFPFQGDGARLCAYYVIDFIKAEDGTAWGERR